MLYNVESFKIVLCTIPYMWMHVVCINHWLGNSWERNGVGEEVRNNPKDEPAKAGLVSIPPFSSTRLQQDLQLALECSLLSAVLEIEE